MSSRFVILPVRRVLSSDTNTATEAAAKRGEHFSAEPFKDKILFSMLFELEIK
jgi:hypothetical protein